MDYVRITEQNIILKNLNPIYSPFKEEESEMILFCRKLKAFLKKKVVVFLNTEGLDTSSNIEIL